MQKDQHKADQAAVICFVDMEGNTNTKTIIFIHGLFMNAKSWEGWTAYFGAKDYKCYTPSYPFHDGDNIALLREHVDSNLGKLTFRQVAESLAAFIGTLPEKPILIGHSIGGLLVQKLIEQGYGVAGVCIDSAPPRGILSFKWSFLKANIPTVNPFKGDAPYLPSVRWFQYAFCNTMTIDQTKVEYDKFVVPESRNIARTSAGSDGKIDFSKPHNPPFLLPEKKIISFLLRSTKRISKLIKIS